MTDLSKSVLKKKRAISLIWFIPFLAIVSTTILIINNTLSEGKTIEVKISSADGIESGKTLVKTRSVNVGRVTNVRLSNDYNSAILTIKMNEGTDGLLKEDSIFWLVKPRIDVTAISGLDTIISGTYLELSVGKSSNYASYFTASDQPVNNYSQIEGTVFTLESKNARRISQGDIIYYKSFPVGRIISSSLNLYNDNTYFKAVIDKQYASLLKQSSKFYVSSGFNLNLNAQGVKLQTESLDSIIRGSISFVNTDNKAKVINDDQTFVLYDDQNQAINSEYKDAIKYVVYIDDASKLNDSSEVIFRGQSVGKVLQAPFLMNTSELFVDNKKIPVLFGINTDDNNLVRKILDKKLANKSLCVGLANSQLFSNTGNLVLFYADHKCNSFNKTYENYRVIPINNEAFEQVVGGNLLEKINKIDLNGISNELKNALKSTSMAMEAFAQNNQDIKDKQLIATLTKTFENFNKAIKSYAPGSPMHNNLKAIIEDLDMILRNLTPATRQIGQNPSAIIFGNQDHDLVPPKGGK